MEFDKGLLAFTIATLVSMFQSMLFIYADKKYAKPIYMKKKFFDNLEENNKHDCEYEYKTRLNSGNILKRINDWGNNEQKDYNQYKTLLLYVENKYKNIGPLFMYYKPESYSGIILMAVMLTLILCNVYLMVFCFNTAPIRFDLHGLLGNIVPNPERLNTVIQNCNLLYTVTDAKLTAILIEMVYYVTVVIAPILVMISLSFTWIFPFFMSYNAVFHCLKEIIIVLQAWSAIDIYLLSSFAVSVEIGEVSDWILNANFPGVCGDDGVIQNIFGVDCFSVKGNVLYGTYLLGIAVIIEWFAFIYTVNYLHKVDIDYNTKIILDHIVHNNS